jgi:hypothetical protein
MAERPYVAGAVAIGVVAAALHLGTAPAPSASPSPGLSVGTHVRRSLQNLHSPFDQVLWEAEMKGHPENLGKLSAQEELKSTLNDFYSTAGGGDDSLPKPVDDEVPPNALEVMIAIEPDPVHTHLALFFDRDMDALEDALQASCYQYQSNWLPWSPPSSAPSSAEHFAAQEEQRLFLQGRESYPGVILFRSNTCNPPRPIDKGKEKTRSPSGGDGHQSIPPGQKPLAVFLVGNSPTAGIDHTQFEEAVHQISLLAPQQPELRILGPTFSGSGRSLLALLSGKAIATLKLEKITIASGSVTDSHCQDFLPRTKIDANCKWSSQDRPAISFVSFGVDKDWRRRLIKDFLIKQGQFAAEQIADLTEDESSYGSTAHKARPTDDPYDPYPHLYFPRNISHLRSAYQNSNIFGFGVSTSGTGNVSLSLNFNETSDDDTVPNFAEQQMPVSQEGVMREITQTIERRHIKVVVLSATDVLDELFVAEILAREAPNTLVIVNQADNLFLRSGSSNDFGNMYFVSPFPLIHQDRLSGSFFPSDTSEGLYAATHFFYPPPDPKTYMPFSYSGLTANSPPLWLSAVGHGDYWPVALLNDQGNPPASFHWSSVVNKPANALVATELPHLSQDLLLLCLCLIAIYHTAKCLGLSAIQDLSYAYTINDTVLRLPKLWLQLGITVLLLVAFQLSLTPAYASRPSRIALYAGSAVLWLAATYLICCIIPIFDPPALWPTAPKSKMSIAGFIVIPLIAFLSWFGLWRLLWYWVSLWSGFPELFKYRASYPLRGVSPVFPLFLTVIAFCILLYSHLDRIAFTDHLRPHLPEVQQDLPNCPGDGELMPVTGLLHWPPCWHTIRFKSVLLALVAIFALVCAVLLKLRPRIFDGSMLQGSLDLAIFLLIVAILWELVMAAIVWQKLKTLCLERLESSSLRRGFSSIRGFTWSSLWIFRGSRSARYRAIFRLLEQSRDALSDEATAVTDGDGLAKSVEKLQAAIASRVSQSIGEAFGAVQKEIALLAGRLLCQLMTAWRSEKGPITACDAAGDEEKIACSSEPVKPIPTRQLVYEEWVALVYIHYVRMVLLQIRSRLVTAAMLYLFLVWAGTSYPYLDRHALLIGLAAILGILSFSVILIYASINRDPILSRTTNHTPGKLDLDFYLKTASLVGVPLIGFVASQFPEVSSFLFSWLEPGMAAVR